MEERIAACALYHYDKVLPRKGKPKDTEWTVYAALVAVQVEGEEEDEEGNGRTSTASSKKGEQLWVVSCATGTKCATFPQRQQLKGVEDTSERDVETNMLRDCHAEVLARRGLMKALWKEIRDYVTTKKESAAATCGEEATSVENFLEKNCRLLLDPRDDSTAENPKFTLRANLSLHLYVSDPPCGDASIYPLFDESDNNFTGAKVIVNALNGVQEKDCGELLPSSYCQASTQNINNLNNSLAKDSTTCVKDAAPVADDGNTGSSGIVHVVAREDVQLLGKLRTKSGRSNLPSHMRSSCMSCSDKLVRWCVLGLQGSLLRSYIPVPIRVESIVVSRDLRALSISAQEEALRRATQRRVESTLRYVSQKQQQQQKQQPGEDGESPVVVINDNNNTPTIDWKGPKLHIVAPRFARGKSSMEYEKKRRAKESSIKSSCPLSSNNTTESNKKRKRHVTSKNNVDVISLSPSFPSSSPCGICLNWDQSLVVSSRSRSSSSSSSCSNNNKNHLGTAEDNSTKVSSSIEQIVGSRGICQGKKPKSVRDYRLLTSRLSRATFAAEHARLLTLSGSTTTNEINEEEESSTLAAPEKEGYNLDNKDQKEGSADDKDNHDDKKNDNSSKSLSYKSWKQAYGGDATYRQVRSMIFADGSPLAGWLT